MQVSVKADTLTLTEAIYKAEANFPLLQQKEYNNALAAVNLDKLGINNLPTVSLNGQASYQSEVVSLPFSLPNMESLELPKERFQFTLDVNQTLYDGGSTRALKQLEKDQNLVN
ncbi:MAG: TolC family protein, partial [Cyclobacteriaceae bacterium]